MDNWILDAQFFNDLNSDYLFQNAKIKAFLKKNDFSKFILVSSKGMGKTLLLRFKRDEIEKNNKSILLIPQNETADYVNLPASLSKDFYSSMERRVFWEDLWKLSISISCLLNFNIRISKEELAQAFSDLQKTGIPRELELELRQSFQNKFRPQRRPSEVLDILLQTGKSNVENLRSSALHTLFGLFNKHVSSACAVFIDSFDQALMHNFSNNLNIWCAAQTGLMKAAWELSRHNRHVKVYVTVRQEAYSSFDDTERLNISGSAVVLEYSKEDLKGIFRTAIRHYEKCNSIEEFLGFKKMYNGYLRTQEDTFDYICRHTIQIPRWLMKLGEELSTTREERGVIENSTIRKKQQKKVAEIINRVSADDLAVEHIVSEMRMFFNGFNPREFLRIFLNNIHSSVISYSSLKRIVKNIVKDPLWAGSEHPFCLMYNLGFIGCISNSANGTEKIQHFQKPYQFNWEYEDILPKNKDGYYLIHPSLHHAVQRLNPKFNFNKTQISDGLSWGKKQIERINNESLKIFISYSHEDWEEVEIIADILDEYLNEKSIIHDIWLDKWKMRGGKWFQDQMYEGLSNSDYLILVVSSSSIESAAVNVEWKTKFSVKLSSNEDQVFPLLIGSAGYSDLPRYLSNIHTYTYKNSEDKNNIIRLIEDIIFWKNEV